MYTDEQLNLLQAIADQAAGAIVKARLLQEAERRTRQLTTLNEVARSLTSTLAIEPLLEQILYSAVEILNCEAGSLLLVEEETGDLVFKVASGPVAADLVGKHLPTGTGLVGKAVDTRLPIIQNDVRRSKEWFDKPDEQTGFTTNDILVVPMQVKDRVSGVVEVINRRDSLPFTADDQELLMAFTSQAAVALENARLYTLTDQSLTDRVEELSVMQRIDRELNASLDISRAMRITLEWAMRQSGADAGLVGIIESEKIRVMTAQGYSTELDQYSELNTPPRHIVHSVFDKLRSTSLDQFRQHCFRSRNGQYPEECQYTGCYSNPPRARSDWHCIARKPGIRDLPRRDTGISLPLKRPCRHCHLERPIICCCTGCQSGKKRFRFFCFP